MSADEAQCIAFLEGLLLQELASPTPDVCKLSIAFGMLELALTPKDESKRQWPQDLPAVVVKLAAAFDDWVAGLSGQLAAAPSPAAKVKAVADAVWGKLSKGYSKNLQHAQHLYNFAALLVPGGVPGVKKQLDCAGVVTTCYAACCALSQRHGHADLATARMQISEDHCWLQLGPEGRRETSVEVTTDTAAKRGLPVAPEPWQGWLYTGGQAVLCTRHQALAALITSIDPAVSGGKKGVESEELQGVQKRLLEVLLGRAPAALYPAAICALADLQEAWAQDDLDAARDRGDAGAVARLLQRSKQGTQHLFECAIEVAAGRMSGLSLEAAATAAPAAATNGKEEAPVADAAAVEAAAEAAVGVKGEGEDTAQQQQQQQPQLVAQVDGCADSGADDDAASQQPQQDQQQQQQQEEQQAEAAAEPANGCMVGLATAASSQPNGSDLATAAGAAPAAANGSSSSKFSPSGDAGRQWYVYSYLAAFLGRRAEFLSSCADAFAADPQQQAVFWQQAVGTYQQALQVASQGGAVLAQYSFAPSTDDQLYKDVEGVLEEVVRDGLSELAKRQAGGQLSDPALLAPLLLLWDGICHLFTGKPKPSGWVDLVMKVGKLFSPEAREAAAAAVEGQVSSGPMLAARLLWRDLKPVQLKPLFESADVGGRSAAGENGGGSGPRPRAAKRQRA